MTNIQEEKINWIQHWNKNSSVPTNHEVWNHITDTELEPSVTHDVAWNIENGLQSDTFQKNELLNELQESNKAMKIEIEKLTKIAATSQTQYIALKNEFDHFVKRVDNEKKEIKIQELTKIVKKFSKLLEQFRLFLSHLDNNLSENAQIQWLQLIYESFISQELTQMWIFQIESLWFIPDSNLHEVLMIQAVSDTEYKNLLEHNIKLNWEKEVYSIDELTWHIISELEVWYYYFDGEKKIVIKPSKVIVAE